MVVLIMFSYTVNKQFNFARGTLITFLRGTSGERTWILLS